MHRLFLSLLAGVLSAGVLCLGATESLTNRSGQAASGVVVTFSESVRIRSYEQAVFPSQDPTGRAKTFTFSGGTLADGGRFRISWTPSSASIADYVWTQPAGSQSASGGMLTYDQIMAQVAHYPGPEEPLYVPSEGEAIWLTDLEGHKDVYDNDSIRVNYAPTFDKSQTTKIEVYRNGVKMRFLPDLFDVLANEQMKTFDGNPAEHTPKSSHVDHAIFGYTYQFTFSNPTGRFAETSVRVRSPVKFSGPTRLASIGHDYYSRLYLTDQDLSETLLGWKAEGFTGIQVEANYFMASASSNEVFAQYEVDSAVCEPWQRTATEAEIRRVLQVAEATGMDAELRLEVNLAKAYVQAQRDWTWRGAIAPSDPTRWFKNYAELCLRLAGMAQEEHAETFCIGVELNSMERYTSEWEAIADAVRTVFSGMLSFSEATSHYLAGFNTYDGESRFVRNVGKFWNSLDVIGMNYWPVHTGRLLEDRKDARFSVMVVNFVSLWQQAVEYYRASYPGKALVFEEMGIYEFDGAASAASVAPPGAISDHQEFADMWAAYVVGAECLGIDGMAFWTFELAPQQGQLWLGTHQINMTPAIRVIGGILSH